MKLSCTDYAFCSEIVHRQSRELLEDGFSRRRCAVKEIWVLRSNTTKKKLSHHNTWRNSLSWLREGGELFPCSCIFSLRVLRTRVCMAAAQLVVLSSDCDGESIYFRSFWSMSYTLAGAITVAVSVLRRHWAWLMH